MVTESKLNIISISSEVSPYSKIGGLGEVARALPKAIKRLGHDVTIITPLYKNIKKEKWGLKKVIQDYKLNSGEKTLTISYWQGELMPGLAIFFVDHEKMFSEHSKIYGAKNDNQRFYLFNIAALELMLYNNLVPDVIQCHDWHTGLIPYLIAKKYNNTPLKNAAVVFTIHNLNFQLGMGWWNVPLEHKDKGLTALPEFSAPEVEYLNFAKRGIRFADAINTVSLQYKEEILTKKFGQDLHRILQRRKHKLFGIVNGIDYNEYNPAKDPGLVVNYDYNTLHLKTKNKTYLQEKFNLLVNPKIPLIGMVSRITEQKGFDLIFKIIDPLMRLNVELIIWGGGDKMYESFVKKVEKKYPKKIGANLELNTQHATRVYAGADIFLMPSRFEPCGLTQLESLRYGAIPIVHKVGGLADTITDYNPRTGRGNGFVFKKYDPMDLLVAITRAITSHAHKDQWLMLTKNGMQQSFSWEIPAKRYIKLFRKAMENKRKNSV